MARKTKAECEETRERLLDAAEEVFLEKGLSCTSIEAIARRAGMTRGAFYWHFRDKAELFDAMVGRVRPPLSEIAEQLAGGSDDDPLEVVRSLCRSGLEQLAADPRHRRVYTILLHRCEQTNQSDSAVKRQEEVNRDVVRLLEEHFTRASEKGVLNRRVSARAAAWALHAYMTGVFSRYLYDPEAFDPGAQSDELMSLFFDGLREHRSNR